MKKWITPVVYILALYLAFTYRDEIFDWLKTNDSMPLLFVLTTLLALFPILPYKAVIGVLGYTCGTLSGASIAWLGTTAAAVIIYAAAASVYREPGRRFLAKFRYIESFTSAVERHPFKAIVIARLMPIVPQMAVNVYAGVASIPFWIYTAASGLGKIPAILIYAYLGNSLANNPLQFAIIAAIMMAVSVIGFVAYRMKHHKNSI
ncbi:VTT domain-containing protein [Paenibacillus sp. N3/727]|uniref:TVP38/TMEM64 family protein n=1 Tax=Paenibacillus sp. N3/727 TaxID=2925845 RepID=UPI001F5354F8|nr:VTT domain-containing protein [Paenibacillus sp. N3/727]UNK20337.1 VTT domain-containing protein [Paenibacillus sp. N3/727]